MDRPRGLKGSGSEAQHGVTPRLTPAAAPPGDRWGRQGDQVSRLRAACREPEPLPVAPGHGTPTPIGPPGNRIGDARALSALVVPSVLPSRKRGRTGLRTTEAKVREAARSQSARSWGGR